MGFETRNGNQYYYRKKREGDKVVSEYVGRGEFAGLLSRFDEITAEQNEFSRLISRSERREIEDIDAQIDEAFSLNSDLVDALFLVNGYHQHKREWRKCRKQ